MIGIILIIRAELTWTGSVLLHFSAIDWCEDGYKNEVIFTCVKACESRSEELSVSEQCDKIDIVLGVVIS